MSVEVRVGDCLDVLRTLDAESVQCCVTSPPYFGLRDYGHAGQIGLEPTPDAYVAKLVEVFAEVRRVLKDDGTLWLNLGDSYAGSWGAQSRPNGNNIGSTLQGGSMLSARQIAAHPKGQTHTGSTKNTPGLKAKDLIGIPWRVAFALQADGWYLRSDIIWAKPNPMPESVTDRPTKAHEYLFLLAKSKRYYYDSVAIAEPDAGKASGNGFSGRQGTAAYHARNGGEGTRAEWTPGGLRNKRTVWSVEATGNRERECLMILDSSLPTSDKWDAIKAMMSGAQSDVWRIATQAYSGAHFATFPPAIIEPCILAGSRAGDTVLDPFGGAGTTGLVANLHSRSALLIELNPDYAQLARDRIKDDNPLFTDVA